MAHDFPTRTVLGSVAVLFVVGLVLFLAVNASSPTAVSKQIYVNPNGTSTAAIVATCTSFPSISGNTACAALSHNVQPNVIPNNPACPNGGTPNQNNQCPTSVTPLDQVPNLNNTQPAIPPARPSHQITVTPVVTFKDASGNTVNVSTNPLILNLNSFLGFKSLSFVTDKNTQIDLNNGFVILQIQIKGNPNEHISANGTMFVKLNSQQLHANGVPWTVNGNTDPTSGIIYANIISPVGFSNQYLFSVANNFGVISQNAANTLNFTLNNVSIQDGNGLTYRGTPTSTFYNAEIDYDGNKVLQKNNQGQFVRILPSDDTLSISSLYKTTSYTAPSCAKCGGVTSMSITTTAPPAIGIAAVYQEMPDGTETLLGTVAGFGQGIAGGAGCQAYGGHCTNDVVLNPIVTGGGTQTITGLPRDTDIRITIANPNGFNLKMHTGLSHEDHVYSCYDSGCTFR